MVYQTVHQQVVAYFHYWPSEAIAIVALVLFSTVTAVNLLITVYTKTWFYGIIVTTGLLEVAGYICRISMIHKPLYGTFVAMQCFLIISPSFLALANYVAVGKLMKALNIKAFIKSKFVSWLFFGLELGALTLQGAGAGLSVSNDGPPKTAGSGKVLLLIGLALQVLFLIIFVAFMIVVFRRAKQLVTQGQARQLNKVYFGLFATSLLLSVRNIFRLVEFSQGWYGHIGTHEVYVYCLDAIPVCICFVLYAVFAYGLHCPDFDVPLTSKPDVIASTGPAKLANGTSQ
jgi:hypothetical protein